jgi:tripartite-type tricarboxylate transporter receptor subunit TctC
MQSEGIAMTRHVFIRAVATAAVCLITAGTGAAQTYPDRPIKLIVPFPPGGPTDVMGRLVAQSLSTNIGQSVVVENRAGAGGTIGAKAVAGADPDGYTLLYGSTSTLAIAPALYKNLEYDPTKGFTPVAMVSDVPFVLVVGPRVPVKSVQELIAHAKANPGKLNFSSAGNGTPPHLTGEMFKAATGTDIVHIPYKGGAPSITDVMAGQVEMTFETTSVLLSLIREGKLKALAVTSATRRPELPDVPTMIESGLAGFRANSWTGVVGPAGLPASVVTKLNAAINDGLKSAAVKETFAKLGVEAKIGSPQDFATMISDEMQKWSAIVKSSGAKID